jgi:hypothetical protein
VRRRNGLVEDVIEQQGLLKGESATHRENASPVDP